MELSNMNHVNGVKEIAYGFITSHRTNDKMSAPLLSSSEEVKTDEFKTQAAKPLERENVSLKDISLTFNLEESYGYIGKDKDVAALDVQKAISDMQKDHILHQYQYFVGNKPE